MRKNIVKNLFKLIEPNGLGQVSLKCRFVAPWNGKRATVGR